MAREPWITSYRVIDYDSKDSLQAGLTESLQEGTTGSFANGKGYRERTEVFSVMSSGHYNGKFTVVYAVKIFPKD